MTTTPRPSRSHAMSEASLYEALAAIEARINKKLDDNLGEMKDLYKENRRANEDTARDLDRHEALEGHPLLLARVVNLENQVKQDKQRPIQTFQIVYSLIYLFISLVSLGLSTFAIIHGFTK